MDTASDTELAFRMTPNASGVKPAVVFKSPSSDIELGENLTSEIVINDTRDISSNKKINFEMTTSSKVISHIEDTAVALENELDTNIIKDGDCASKTIVGVIEPDNNKNAICNIEFNLGLTTTSERNTFDLESCSDVSNFKLGAFLPDTNVDSVKSLTNKNASSNEGFSFKSELLSLGGKSNVPSIAKEFSGSFLNKSAKSTDHAINEGNSSNLEPNFDLTQTVFGSKQDDDAPEHSPSKNKAKLSKFSSVIAVDEPNSDSNNHFQSAWGIKSNSNNTNSTTFEDVRSEIGFIPLSSEWKPTFSLSNPFSTNTFKFENTVSETTSDCGKTSYNKNASSNPGFCSKLKSMCDISLQTMPDHNKDHNFFYRGSAVEDNDNSDSCMEIDSGLTTSRGKLNPLFRNLRSVKEEKLENFPLGNTNFVTGFNIGLSSNSSKDKPCFISEKQSENVGDFKFTHNKIFSEKTSENGEPFIFGSPSHNPKLPEKTSGHLGRSTFGFSNAYGKQQKKQSGYFDLNFEFHNTNQELEVQPVNVETFSFGLHSANEEVEGTTLKFNPFCGIDTMKEVKTITTRHQCICMMREYLHKSLEELRFEDYEVDRKGRELGESTSQVEEPLPLNSATTFNSNVVQRNFQNFDAKRTIGVDKLLKGLENLLLSGKHSDVTINVQGKDFSVHKNILSVWSSVFSAMMEHDTEEKDSGVINIIDCDPDSFSVFLDFLYSGSTRILNSENFINLYAIAERYQVLELCKLCVNYMKENITVQNFCDILTLSQQHKEIELNNVATNFFVENSVEIAVTATWELFLKENPVTGNELFLKALKGTSKA